MIKFLLNIYFVKSKRKLSASGPEKFEILLKPILQFVAYHAMIATSTILYSDSGFTVLQRASEKPFEFVARS